MLATAYVQAALQWGRVSKNAEIPVPTVLQIWRYGLQWGRAPGDAETTISGWGEKPREVTSASMAPRPVGRGNTEESAYATVNKQKLQWGRTLADAEMLQAIVPIGRTTLRWGRAPEDAEAQWCNWADLYTAVLQWGHARGGRGNNLDVNSVSGEYSMLQWGRAPEDAEMRPAICY